MPHNQNYQNRLIDFRKFRAKGSLPDYVISFGQNAYQRRYRLYTRFVAKPWNFYNNLMHEQIFHPWLSFTNYQFKTFYEKRDTCESKLPLRRQYYMWREIESKLSKALSLTFFVTLFQYSFLHDVCARLSSSLLDINKGIRKLNFQMKKYKLELKKFVL